MKSKYQINYSAEYPHEVISDDDRAVKAQKVLAVLNNVLNVSLKNLRVLEVGCFTGRMSVELASYFNEYTAVDIDLDSLRIALERKNKVNTLQFKQMNAEMLTFLDCDFDIVIFSQVYEHLPNPDKALQEIYRVLKPGGICYFSAGNRLILVEPHYELPFLSWLPKSFANNYVQLMRKKSGYYETYHTYWGLKKLTRNFEIFDYTLKILTHPVEFHATDMIVPGTFKQRFAILLYRLVPWSFPAYVWALRKPQA